MLVTDLSLSVPVSVHLNDDLLLHLPAAAGDPLHARYPPTLLTLTATLLTSDLSLSLRCYSDHSGPNSAGGVEVCDEDGVCMSSRWDILYK